MGSSIPLRAAHRRPGRRPRRLLALLGDDRIVAAVRGGDEAAFEVLFDRYSPRLLAFCRQLLGSHDAAEDATQQTFISAYSALRRDSRRIELKPWLYAIARNRCVSMLRATRERPTEAIEADTTGLPDEVEQRAELRQLLADLQDLPEEQRAALALAELGDLSQAEIANVLGIGVANVKGLVFRARSGLIERREARGQPCEEVQERLANLRGGALRAGALRHHLKDCPDCREYLAAVRSQKRMLGLVLPIVPSVALKRGVLGAVGATGGSGAAGGAASIVASTAALKAVALVACASVVGVGAERAIDRPERAGSANSAPAATHHAAAADAGAAASGGGRADEPARRAGGGGHPRHAARHAKAQGAPAGAGAPSVEAPSNTRRGHAISLGQGRGKPGTHPGGTHGRSGSAPGRLAAPPKAPAAPRKGGVRAHGVPAPQAKPTPVAPEKPATARGAKPEKKAD